jgi:hypothetical protein
MFTFTMGLAGFVLFLTIFIKKFMIYVMLLPLWFGVIILSSKQGMEDSQYIQGAAGLVIIYAVIGAWLSLKKGGDIV